MTVSQILITATPLDFAGPWITFFRLICLLSFEFQMFDMIMKFDLQKDTFKCHCEDFSSDGTWFPQGGENMEYGIYI